MNTRRGRTLKLFLVDGTPEGVTVAELGMSSVLALKASKTSLPELLRREEAKRTGVYLLIGPNPNLPGSSLVYVGEGDEIRTRLRHHDTDETKDFFTRAVFVVSKDENLTKAHGRYLEGRLIAAIKVAGRAKLVNATEPLFKGLPEPEIADMERMLDEIELLLSVLGFDVLTPSPAPHSPPATAMPPRVGNPDPQTAVNESSPVFAMEIRKAKGRALERRGEFVVLAGSTALRRETPGIPLSVSDKRKLLIETGILVEDVDLDLLRFVQDASFGSPSGASAAIVGRASNGRQTWVIEGDGRTYDSWRTSQIGEVLDK